MKNSTVCEGWQMTVLYWVTCTYLEHLSSDQDHFSRSPSEGGGGLTHILRFLMDGPLPASVCFLVVFYFCFLVRCICLYVGVCMCSDSELLLQLVIVWVWRGLWLASVVLHIGFIVMINVSLPLQLLEIKLHSSALFSWIVLRFSHGNLICLFPSYFPCRSW